MEEYGNHVKSTPYNDESTAYNARTTAYNGERTAYTMAKAPRITLEPLRIDKMPFDHLRQLWLSIKENQR
jgi:hypothetical protein